MGISPMQYVQHLRLEEAKRLLRSTDLPIAEIAEQVGFADALYFSRLIHRESGVSPSLFRQRAK
jgi:AraC-like DNA-binding protein